MKITVILCTYNRKEVLAKALERVAASRLPETTTWEVLVVDNNSSDGTREVISDFTRRYPDRVRYFFEPRPGKSNALNAGIREARGEILAFTDDDVEVEQTWLRNLTAALDETEWAGVGGRTLPLQTVPLPGWLTLEGPYSQGGALAAIFDLGDKPRELDRPPYGANMAFRKWVFEKYGGFRADLGPSPDRSIPRHTEDTEFGRRVMAGGERLGYEPTAVVRHVVSADRVEKQYLLSWWFDYGRAASREIGRKPDIFGIPRYWISIPKITATMLIPAAIRWLLALEEPKRFFFKCWIWAQFGQMAEIHRQRRNAVGH